MTIIVGAPRSLTSMRARLKSWRTGLTSPIRKQRPRSDTDHELRRREPCFRRPGHHEKQTGGVGEAMVMRGMDGPDVE